MIHLPGQTDRLGDVKDAEIDEVETVDTKYVVEVLKTEPIPLALREPLRTLPEAGPLGLGMVLWIACHDANALHDLIVTRGGAILSPLADDPFGRFFVAGDPDGYAITFHTALSRPAA